MDTLDPVETQDTQDPNAVAEAEPVADAQPEFSWKSNLNPDYANSPTMKKYADTKEGFNDAARAHLDLQKMMGHDKVPIPKGPDDKIAIDLFKKALRVPENPDGYALPDPEMPDSMKELKFDKAGFQTALHKHNLTPEQAKGVWQDYTESVKQQYAVNMKGYEDTVAEASNQMRAEWGDAYDSKIAVGQMVINKFADSPEQNDYITANLAKDPNGIKFLAKIGEQFAENKIGDFKYQRYSLTPDEAQMELTSIRGNMGHPYNDSKAPANERQGAIDYVNSLIAVVNKAKTRQ